MGTETLGRYRLLRLLATGGMGEVFLAEQEGPQSFKRRVVVKRLLRHLATDPTFVDMFLEEARVAALIAHPNVTQIIELGEEDGTYFIAMEYVRGQSLRQVLRTIRAKQEKMPPEVAVAIMVGVLRGLHAAHTLVDDDGKSRGCVHRDVSAENVLLSVEGAVKIVDFGIAKALSASTARGTMLRGKYGYMAPEQYLRERIDARTDVFASGVLLYELLAGQRPFVAESEAGVMHSIITDAPPPLHTVAAAPPALEALVTRALAKVPDERFQSAEAMANALEALLVSGELGSAEATGSLRAFARGWLAAESAPEDPPSQRAPSPEPVAISRTATAPLDEAEREPTRPTATVPRKWRVAVIGGAVGIVAVTTALAVTSAARRPIAADTLTGAPSTSASPSAPPVQSETIAATAPPASSQPANTEVAGTRESPALPRRPTSKGTHSPAPASEKTTGTGTLALRVRPWAEVFIDGKSVGISPLSPQELSAGKHVLLLRNRDLGKERSVTAKIAPGETTTLRVDLLE